MEATNTKLIAELISIGDSWEADGLVHKFVIGPDDYYVLTAEDEQGKLINIKIVGTRANQNYREAAAVIMDMLNLMIEYAVPYNKIYWTLRFNLSENEGFVKDLESVKGFYDAMGKWLERTYPDGTRRLETVDISTQS